MSYAQSLDGCITVSRGQPYTLSGSESQTLTHALRAAHDAVMVGIDTVIADDPSLTVRFVKGVNPLPIVLDSRLRLPVNSKILRGRMSPVIAATSSASLETQQKLETLGARIVRTEPDERGWVDLPELLEQLRGLGIESIMVEGGARVITSFLAQHLVDWIVITIAPKLLAGLHAIEPVCLPKGDGLLSGLVDSRNVAYYRMGNDIVVWAPVARANP